jgi:hypothetical protein
MEPYRRLRPAPSFGAPEAAEPNHRNHPAIAAVDVLAIDEKALEIHDPEAKRAA